MLEDELHFQLLRSFHFSNRRHRYADVSAEADAGTAEDPAVSA